jgi:tetratricopeptide (TPR) repeat protein
VFYDSALEMMPGAIEPLSGLVRAYSAKGQLDKAEARISSVAAIRPKDFLIQDLLAAVLVARNKRPEAEAAYRRAIELNPKLPGTYEELAKLHAGNKQPDNAIATIRQGLQALPGNTRLNHQLAMLLFSTGKKDAAIQSYEEILRTQPRDELAANNLATLLLDERSDQQSHARALEIAKRFSESTDAARIDTLGWAYYRTGQLDQAVSYLRRANEKAPSVPIFDFHLGMALYKNGDATHAKPFLEEAVKSGAKFSGIDDARKIIGES